MQKMAENTAKVELAGGDCDILPRVGERRGRLIETAQISAVSPADSDALYSLRAIAAFCGMTPGQAKPFTETGIIPTFRLPGSTVLCASKATIREAWQRYQAEWRDKHPIDIKEKLRQRKQKREVKIGQWVSLNKA
jgi:hypothetical protein